MSDFITLGGIGYTVTHADGQVIFEERSPVWSCHTQFAFEKKREINDTPGIWYLVHTDASSDQIPALHIIQAYAYCCEQFGKSFEDKPAPQPHDPQP